MKCLVIDGPARGQKLDLNTNSLSYVVDHAHGSGPGGYQPHRYEPTDLTPEAAQRGFTIALAYAGIEPA